MKISFFSILVAAAMVLPALSAQAQDTESRLRQRCMDDGKPEACCDCGYQVLKATFADWEFNAFVEAMDTIPQLKEAYENDDKAKIVVLESRLQELQQLLSQSRMDELKAAIDAECSSDCP